MNDHYRMLLKNQYRQVSKMFSEKQVERLIELVQENENSLFPNSFSRPNRKTSRKAWAAIAHTFNSEFPTDAKTPEQIRIKWKNMRQKARETGNFHLLSTNAFPGREVGESTFNYKTSTSDQTVEDVSDFDSSVANVLNAFSDRIENGIRYHDFGIKYERESSVLSTPSEPKSEPSALNSSREMFPGRRSVEPRQSISNNSIDDNAQTSIIHITEGPPIILDHVTSNVAKRPSEDIQQSYSNLIKRRRTIVEEIDEIKRDLLAEELKNSKKIGLVLDEALNFMKRLNQTNGIADKLGAIINGI